MFFGLMMLQTFGAGCTAFVEVGDDSGHAAGPDDDANGTGSGGGVSAEVGSSVGSGGGDVSAEVGSSVGSGGGDVSAEVGSSVGSGGGVSAEVGSESATAGAIALLGSQLPELPDDPWSSSATGGGPSPDPDDLMVILGAPARSCAAPNAALECGDWRVSFRIPPALQVPGIIDFSDENFYLLSLYHVNGPDRGDGDCSRIGGIFTSGTLEIVSIDAANVVVRLSGTEADRFDANGEYTAARCP
ncbi:hypothetical protein BE04_07165 [Sorangium cellulosum]|uniref:Uncharacterized protein n=1 Tax=Sorangium cellulosum TaxID=56 RepID=A0A150Q5V6_SORCE|nr:hypothetical protein BE04_07165 [Sorangium cellulosum]